MQIPVEITLRDIPQSDAVEARIREKVAKLERFHGRIMSCRVTVESPQHRKHQGRLYSVHIDIKVPGSELVVNRVQHEDVYVAMRDAFVAATRQLEDRNHIQKGQVKNHDVPQVARVVQMFPAQGYGFLETPDRRQIYFQRNSVVEPEFDRLEIGTEVQFIEEEGEQGPQARRVTVGKHRVPD